MKREEYLSWDEYFMGIAVLSAKRSKDPSTQVGACIVNKDNRIISVGYNGMPRCCSDDEFPWDKNDNPLDSKYLYGCHAELNAILKCDRGNVRDCICYTTLFPCNECAKAIIQSGMSEVVYMEDKYADSDSVVASKKMFDTAGVKYRLYNKSGKEVYINL